MVATKKQRENRRTGPLPAATLPLRPRMNAEQAPPSTDQTILGDTLTEDEQDILDAGQPKDMDAKTFFTMINQLHHARDNLLLCTCNSGGNCSSSCCTMTRGFLFVARG